MKKVLFYTDTPNVGGAEKHMLLLAKYLQKQGVSVLLAYGRYSRLKTMRADFEAAGARVFELRTFHKHDPRHYFELRGLLEKERPDLLHIHLWNPGAGRYAFFAGERTRVPAIATEHDPFELHGVKRWIKKRCLRRTTHTIAVSDAGKRAMQVWYGLRDEAITTVHNGIEMERFVDSVSTVDLPLSPDDRVITCVAELHERKGHRYLLEAFSALKKTYPLLQLWLVGEGPAKQQLLLLQRQLQQREPGIIGRVHFLGWRNDVPAILKRSEIFVLPSLSEAFGLAVIEAMASGVAVVGTASGGVPEIVENGVTGLLVPPADSRALATAIATLLDHPEKKREIEAAALQRVREQFTAEGMAEKTIAVYERV